MNLTSLNERELEAVLSQPSSETRDTISRLTGDIVVLGAGGKMGPTLAMMLHQAAPDKTVFAVSRFSNQAVKDRLDQAGVTTIAAELLDASQHRCLPQVANVYYLAGMKFGASGNQPMTWALNSYLPGRMAELYREARLVVLSTGNVYPFVNPAQGGAQESDSPDPRGEYAQSCLGRERVCQYFSQENQTPMTIVRLNYANEARYGIIVDLSFKIMQEVPIDLSMAAVNLIWQRDANDYIARAITLAQSPARILNVTGPEIVKIRDLAGQIGELLGKAPQFTGEEGTACLLSDASECFDQLGHPATSLDEMIAAIVPWVASGKPVLNKPTKYEIRDGQF
ncbi:MAG: NAD(P)-dependent oxidoreductase [Planctomycetes bacterium]|nr:NAD(P)-dependent oxidoreductase [Planctomycetota bacterium]